MAMAPEPERELAPDAVLPGGVVPPVELARDRAGVKFAFAPPDDVSVVGSYLLRC